MRDAEGLFEKKEAYRDFDVRFMRNPVNGDVVTLTTEESIKQSVKLLILTALYERPYQPRIGTRLASALFELYNPDLVELVRKEVRECLELYEPRVVVQNVDVGSVAENLDSNSIRVHVSYLIVGKVRRVEQEIILRRIR
jgi:phage baseplate assembly protein W